MDTAIDWPTQNNRDAMLRTSSTVNFRKIQYLVPSRVKTLRMDVTSMNQVSTLMAGVQVSRNSGLIVPGVQIGKVRTVLSTTSVT